MSEEILNGAAASAEQPAGPVFTVEKIYVKDISFEAPNSPHVFNENVQPQLQLNLNQRVTRLAENVFEVVLGVTLTCKAEERTVYLAEVEQAGLFQLAGFEPAMLDAMLGTHCPNILFPYARQIVGDLIQAGGFPPFLLQPINFEALYAESLRQRMTQQPGEHSPLAGTDPAGNA